MVVVGLCLVCAVTVVPPGSRLLHLQDGQERRSEEGMEGHGVSPPPPGTGERCGVWPEPTVATPGLEQRRGFVGEEQGVMQSTQSVLSSSCDEDSGGGVEPESGVKEGAPWGWRRGAGRKQHVAGL